MVKKINTPQVIAEVAERMGCYKKDTRELLEHFAAVIAEHVAKGERVSFKPLGIFYAQRSRRGRGTGQILLKFRAAKGIQRTVRATLEENKLDLE
ncbi:histone family protein DNA-binding protein [Desulfotomaculum nigrificans CO-1-SRB]|uniref:Histone family protein DNA-binding protein n=1 Tax=Desulfotomaculum nigrificans (strain DSM 14880 / VKM B-2319 / CO-1-SRB) TaxID=868595 RepID=F6B2S8_DESCC|nr:HU family DNA-binding protein [Desulfotomaculum nigrificans]AEF95036.1 histone family protein DNA-binding protein [Desulfotomaculum nigrificans CO-1-SRB]